MVPCRRRGMVSGTMGAWLFSGGWRAAAAVLECQCVCFSWCWCGTRVDASLWSWNVGPGMLVVAGAGLFWAGLVPGFWSGPSCPGVVCTYLAALAYGAGLLIYVSLHFHIPGAVGFFLSSLCFFLREQQLAIHCAFLFGFFYLEFITLRCQPFYLPHFSCRFYCQWCVYCCYCCFKYTHWTLFEQ